MRAFRRGEKPPPATELAITRSNPITEASSTSSGTPSGDAEPNALRNASDGSLEPISSLD